MTFLVAKNFRAALRTTPSLAQCSEKLRTVACPASAASIQPYHCLAGVFMDQYCVVIDPVFSAKAFKVPYNGSFETLPYITTSGLFQQRCFRYIAGPSGDKLLTMEKIGSIEAAVQFSDVDHKTALRQISMRAARESKPGFQVPSKKALVVRSLIERKADQDCVNSFECRVCCDGLSRSNRFRPTNSDDANTFNWLAFQTRKWTISFAATAITNVYTSQWRGAGSGCRSQLSTGWWTHFDSTSFAGRDGRAVRTRKRGNSADFWLLELCSASVS